MTIFKGKEHNREIFNEDIETMAHQIIRDANKKGMSTGIITYMGKPAKIRHDVNGVMKIIPCFKEDLIKASEILNNTEKPKKESKTAEPSKFKAKIDKFKKTIELNKEKTQLIQSWIKVMAHCKKYNNNYDTFEIVDETKRPYGWWFRLYAPDGLSFEDLKSLRPAIENNLGCTFMYKVDKSNKFATCKIIYEANVKCNDIPFEPVKVKPYEVCPGVKVTGEPLIIDANASPHILLAGATRRGKNGAADSVILNWINSCSPDELHLYLFQCAKIDLIKYQKCKHVKCCVIGDFYKMLDVTKYIVEVEIPRRLELFKDMFSKRKGENIYDYNLLYPESTLPYSYLIFDEFLELMMQSTSKADKEINDVKNEILTNIQRIGQMGAAVGIQYMIMHQKPEKALCPTFIKNMSNIRICFGFDDESCGRIVLGDENGGLVVGLPARRAYVNNNGLLELIYTTNLGEGRRDMFITPNEVDSMQDIFDEIKTHHEDSAPKPVEKDIKQVENKTDQNDTVKPDAGTATLPSKVKENKQKDITNDLSNEINTPKEIIEKTKKVSDNSIKGVKENITDTPIVEQLTNVKNDDTTENKTVINKQDSENGAGNTKNTSNVKYVEELEETDDKMQPFEVGEGLPTMNFSINEVYGAIVIKVSEDNQNEVKPFETSTNEGEGNIDIVKTALSEENCKNITIVDEVVPFNMLEKNNAKQGDSKIITESETTKGMSTADNKKKQSSKKRIAPIPDFDKVDFSAINRLQTDIEKLVAENAKKNPGWVPYVPKDGEKEVSIDSIKPLNKIKTK